MPQVRERVGGLCRPLIFVFTRSIGAQNIERFVLLVLLIRKSLEKLSGYSSESVENV